MSLWATLCLSLDIGSLTSFLSTPISILGACGVGFDSLAGLVSAGLEGFDYSFFYCLGSSFFVSSFLTYCLGSYFLAYCFGAPPAGFAPSGSISNKGFPTSKLSPALTWNFNNFPAWGLLISTVTLSVSTLATVSSCSTQSPYSEILDKEYFWQIR